MNKILMIEHDTIMVGQAQERLSDAGYEMISANDGPHGFRMAKERTPDLIIADANIPLMSGFELCKAIKLDRDIKSTPRVVLTEKHRMEDSFMFLGINDFLNKPLIMDELEDIVKKRLRSSQNMGLTRNTILISGRPEVVTCCQQLLKDSTHWTEYYAYNNDSFLRDAARYAPDVILIDLLMPEIPADDMIRELKKLPALKNPVILTYYSSTSTSRDPLAVQAQMIEVQYMKRLTFEAGAKEYLGPFNPVTLPNLINVYHKQFNYLI